MTMPAAIPRIFVSHSHADNTFCRRIVDDLRAAGADVWYDEYNLGWGELRREIDREMPTRPNFVVILSPEAVESEWVSREIDGALDLMRDGTVQAFLPVVACPCTVPATLRGFRRVDYTTDEATARVTLFNALGLPLPISGERFPVHLAHLGFIGRVLKGVETILPPVCEVVAGEFLMGSDPRRDLDTQDNEKPQHRVTLPAYRIGRYPVTVAEYACFVRAGQREPQNWPGQQRKIDHPVVYVSWRDATAYAAWLTTTTEQVWRLPAEPEWEKAARDNDGRIYPWGDSFDQTLCNTEGSGNAGTTPVGTYPGGASPCSAQDMAGNVWEWTSSLHRRYPYLAADEREDLTAPGTRALRGGSRSRPSRIARVAFRGHNDPDILFGCGFRLVCAEPGAA